MDLGTNQLVPVAPVKAQPFSENAFRAFVRTFGLMERVMNPFFLRFGVSGAQWGVLRSLHRAEGEGRDALSVTELSDRLIIRPPSVTGVIDRMIREGLVTRQALPTDMRVKQIRLTPKARELIAKVAGSLEAKIGETLSGMNQDEQDELQRLLGVMGKQLEAMLITESA